MKAILSKIPMFRLMMILVIGLSLIGGVVLGIHVKQALFQDSSDEEYD